MCRGNSLVVLQLHLADRPPLATPIFTQHPFETLLPPNEEASDARCCETSFIWSPNDACCAIHVAMHKQDDFSWAQDAYSEVLYIYTGTSQSLNKLTHMLGRCRMNISKCAFSPSGRCLVVPLQCEHTQKCQLQIYDTQAMQQVGCIEPTGTFDKIYSLAFDPSGQQSFAAAFGCSVVIYDASNPAACQVVTRIPLKECSFGGVHATHDRAPRLAFSPEGDILGIYHESEPSIGEDAFCDTTHTTIRMCNMASGNIRIMRGGSLEEARPKEGPKPLQLCMNFHVLIAVSTKRTRIFSIKADSFGEHIWELDQTHTAVSQHGIFLAAVIFSSAHDHMGKPEVCIYQVATGQKLHQYQIQECFSPADPLVVAQRILTFGWAGSDLHLLVGARTLYYRVCSESAVHQERHELAVFSF